MEENNKNFIYLGTMTIKNTQDKLLNKEINMKILEEQNNKNLVDNNNIDSEFNEKHEEIINFDVNVRFYKANEEENLEIFINKISLTNLKINNNNENDFSQNKIDIFNQLL